MSKENSLMKICITCKINKSINEYRKSKKVKSGISNKCKICANQYEKDRILKNKNPETKNKKEEIFINNNTEKLCSVCKIYKIFSEFPKSPCHKFGIAPLCKICKNLKRHEDKEKLNFKSRLKRIENKDEIRKRDREYYYTNKDKILEGHKKYFFKHKHERDAYKKEYRKINLEKVRKYEKEYNIKNKEAIQVKRKAYRELKKKDPHTIIRKSVSSLMLVRLKKNKKGKSCFFFFFYTLKELKLYLESKFTKGMTWDNYGKGGWNLDHIIPDSLFKYNSYDHPAFKACWALENLQPLWETTAIAKLYGESNDYIGNIDKGNRIIMTPEIQKLLNKVNEVNNG